jgi:hypothetical protein
MHLVSRGRSLVATRGSGSPISDRSSASVVILEAGSVAATVSGAGTTPGVSHVSVP